MSYSNSSSGGSSSSTPISITSPQSDWGLDLSKLLSALGQNQYSWAMDQFNRGMGVTDQNINQFMQLAGKGAGLAENLLGRYKDVFEPMMNKFIQQASDYNSEGRQRFMMGRAESTAAQADKAAMDEAMRTLVGEGINVNNGMTQDILLSKRLADAATRAGAGTEASVNTAAIGRQMTQAAAQMGQNVPGMTVNALQSAYTGVNSAEQAILGMLNTGANLTNSSANFFNAAANANKYPPVGNKSQSGQSSSSQSQKPQQDDKGGGSGSGRNAGGGGRSGGDGSGGRGRGDGTGEGVGGIGGGLGIGPPGAIKDITGRPDYDPNAPDPGWQEQYNELGPSPDPNAGQDQFSAGPDQGWQDQFGELGPSPDTALADDANGPNDWNPNQQQDFSGGEDYQSQDLGGDYQNQDLGGDFQSQDLGGDYEQQPSQSAGGAPDTSGSDYGSYKRGGKVGVLPTSGGGVPRQASPSQGRQTDDVPARLNAGEFVIPRDVTAHKGQEFFHKLIEKSRRSRTGMAGPPAQPKMKPALRMRPTFVSRPMGA